MVPPLMAELASLWIEDGTADAVLEAKRREAAGVNALARRLLDGFPLETRTTGFFVGFRFRIFLGEWKDFQRPHGVREFWLPTVLTLP